jgi:hypothetical protein|nr:MAG TPA: hypothetical protein [Caudoviricetes sp.]
MKQICKLAVQKGFKAKVLSTDWTLKDYNDKNSGFKINNTCDYLLLSEIQKWIREEFEIYIQVFYHKSGKFEAMIVNSSDNVISTELFGEMFISYEEALMAAIKETLKII